MRKIDNRLHIEFRYDPDKERLLQQLRNNPIAYYRGRPIFADQVELYGDMLVITFETIRIVFDLRDAAKRVAKGGTQTLCLTLEVERLSPHNEDE